MLSYFQQNGKLWADPMGSFPLQRYKILKKNHNAVPRRKEEREKSIGSRNGEKLKPELSQMVDSMGSKGVSDLHKCPWGSGDSD